MKPVLQKDKEIFTAFPRGRQTEAFIESSDFTHDVRLYVNGDFESPEQAFEYAKSIASKLNNFDKQL